MAEKVTLSYDGNSYEMDIIEGTANEKGIDIAKLRAATGLITLDEGYVNTGSARSAVTYLNGEEGILRYRGYSIEDLAEKSSFSRLLIS